MAINFPATPSTNQTYTFNGRTWTWNGVGWQATGSTGLTVYTKTDFTATAGQTSFSCTYTVGFVDVYYNGSKLSTSEYTATTGSTVVLGTACAVGDIVETIAWTISSSFNPSLGSASATSLALGGATIGTDALAVTGTATISGVAKSGKVWQSSRNAYTNFVGFSPTATVSTTKVMMGIGSSVTLTPSFSGRVRVTICGTVSNNTGAQASYYNGYYGSGTAPANGAALTGTALMTLQLVTSAPLAFNTFPYSIIAEVTGLTLSTAYWFDLGLASSSGAATSTIYVSSIIVEEF